MRNPCVYRMPSEGLGASEADELVAGGSGEGAAGHPWGGAPADPEGGVTGGDRDGGGRRWRGGG